MGRASADTVQDIEAVKLMQHGSTAYLVSCYLRLIASRLNTCRWRLKRIKSDNFDSDTGDIMRPKNTTSRLDSKEALTAPFWQILELVLRGNNAIF